MQIFPRCWTKIMRINFLQRKIIINCILYYELNVSKLTDKQYDELSHQLVELQQGVDVKNETEYGYCMFDFDGNTGFDLFSRLTDEDKEYLLHLARYIAGTPKPVKKKKKGGLF